MGSRRAIVTGAGGFVGACLARRVLEDGHAVELWVRPGSETWRLDALTAEAPIVEVDLTDDDSVLARVRRAGVETVFHLAAHGAYSWQTDVRRIMEVNAVATTILAEAAVAAGCEAFVHAGSSSEYGLKDHAPHEGELPEPNSAYAVGKAAATAYCRWLAQREGTLVRTLRLYSVYGPWEEAGRLIPTLVALGLEGRLPPLVHPDVARDFVFVEDVCDAFLLAAAERSGDLAGVYNVGTGHQTTLRELVDVARAALSIGEEPDWGTMEARSWDTATWVADPTRIARELGWRPRTGLEDGLRATAAWLQERSELRARYAAS